MISESTEGWNGDQFMIVFSTFNFIILFMKQIWLFINMNKLQCAAFHLNRQTERQEKENWLKEIFPIKTHLIWLRRGTDRIYKSPRHGLDKGYFRHRSTKKLTVRYPHYPRGNNQTGAVMFSFNYVVHDIRVSPPSRTHRSFGVWTQCIVICSH